ncbi:SMI1/KNR4 family protein [Streptomyces sp. NPDC048637]|uniref:SMI1/KNR4 family protein n=1 Tax=Streptomyces sp. NPDC048637 TaxID=3155636 RepID=UPI0034277602
MWREFISRLGLGWELTDPARQDDIAAVEEVLRHPFPDDLKALLLESDGVRDDLGGGVVWDLKRIREDNSFLRTDASIGELYMPFDSLLFFGDNGGGDQFAFARTGTGTNVYVWDHEDDSRRCVANGLDQYLQRTAQADTPDWFRRR